jgi:hypothetical protein
MVHFTSTCADVEPILNPLRKVAKIPIQHEENMNEPPSNVTPHAPAIVYMMQRSHMFHIAAYIRMMKKISITLMTARHAMIFHSLHARASF